jgi:hypothetical protein
METKNLLHSEMLAITHTALKFVKNIFFWPPGIYVSVIIIQPHPLFQRILVSSPRPNFYRVSYSLPLLKSIFCMAIVQTNKANSPKSRALYICRRIPIYIRFIFINSLNVNFYFWPSLNGWKKYLLKTTPGNLRDKTVSLLALTL